ncbi:MAG TPA: hypothetical protein VLA90_04325 [Actinomycetota bacterium]|nr:hypothetical protein [Actinomycetota bacterium]
MATKVLGWLLMLGGLLLDAVAIVALIVAYDGSRHGWASLRDAAPVPIAAIILGSAMVVGGVFAARRGRSA